MRSSTRQPTNGARITAALLTTTMLLSACSVGPDYKRPFMPIPTSFKEAIVPLQQQPAPSKTFIGPMPLKQDPSQQLIKARPSESEPRGKWWEVFKDNDLNKLEEQVNINNQNIKLAEANWHQARALVAEARSAYFPTLGVSGSMTRNGSGGGSASRNTNIGNSAVATSTTSNTATANVITTGTSGGYVRNNYDASADASWVPDIWGQVRREVESARATAQGSAADLASAQLLAQAELAVDYLDLRMADEQRRILDNSVKAFSKSLQITQNQYKIGVAANSDVLQAKVLLETTQAQLVDVGVQRAEFEHAIAMLIGKSPSDFALPETPDVPSLPDIPPGVPSQLLERRPDIASAERKVAAANAQIGVAESAFFPTLTLSATGGYSSTELYQWFTLPTRFWSIGPSLAETIFNAGLRAAQTEAAIDVYDGTVATYRQSVLNAFQAVEDNLAQLRVYEREAEVLTAAVKDARAEVTVALNQYKAGTISYLNVVTAQTAELNNEITELTVRKERLTAAATLIENLGGGWDAAELSKPEVTQGKTGPWSFLPPKVDMP